MHFGHKSRAITHGFLNEIIPLAIPYHSSLIPMSVQSLKKISKKVPARKRSAKHFWHTSRAVTLLFQNKISPLGISYHSSLIPMSMQSLKKIGQKVLKLEHRNEVLTDRQTDGQMTDGHSKFGGYNIIPSHFCVAGYNNEQKSFIDVFSLKPDVPIWWRYKLSKDVVQWRQINLSKEVDF